MTKSFGLHLLEHFCKNGLTPPILARAIGVWTGDLERVMAENNPTPDMLSNLVQLSAHAWLFGVDVLTQEQVLKWVEDWDAADPKDRTTVTESTWEEPELLSKPDYSPGIDKKAWLIKNPVLTLEAWKSTWQYFGEGVTAEEMLRSFRWYPMQEYRKGHVWRWNPLKVGRSRGKPNDYFQPSVYFPKKDPVNDTPLPLRNARRDRVQTILSRIVTTGAEQVKFQAIVRAYYGRDVKNSKMLQDLRNAITDCGWVYNMYAKVWEPKTKINLLEDNLVVDLVKSVTPKLGPSFPLKTLVKVIWRSEAVDEKTTTLLERTLISLGWQYQPLDDLWHLSPTISNEGHLPAISNEGH